MFLVVATVSLYLAMMKFTSPSAVLIIFIPFPEWRLMPDNVIVYDDAQSACTVIH